MSSRETPTFSVFEDITTLNDNISSVSSQAQSLQSDVPLSDFLILQSTFNEQSTTISTLEIIQNEYYFISSYFYDTISSRFSLEAQAGYLSSQTNLYFASNIIASSFNVAQSLAIGSGSITSVGAIIGIANTLSTNSLVVGNLNIADAIGVVATGYGNNVTGSYSHADGSSSEITGAYSHADGGTNSNYASYAHIDGFRNKISTLSDGGHVDGRGNLIMNNISSAHAEGYITVTQGDYGHSEGTFTSSIGLASHAEGFDTRAEGSNSHSEGYLTVAKGIASHTEGFSTAIEIGNFSHGEGQSNIIYAQTSHAEGFQTIVTSGASNSHAEGWASLVSSANAHAEGRGSYAIGLGAHVECWSSIANSLAAHIEGSNNISGIEDGIHIEGFDNVNSEGACTHTEGQVCQTSSIAAHAHGSNTKALGLASHAHGAGAVALGIASHAHGFLSLSTVSALGNYSHVHGSNVVASGIAATGIGLGTVQITTGSYSVVSGSASRANGDNSFVCGTINFLEAPYSNMCHFGGQSNFTRLTGSIGVSSGTQTFVYPGIGSVVLGGLFSMPRNNWSIVSANGLLSNIQGTSQTELFNLYCTTSTTNTYCNLIYLSNKADIDNPTSSNMCSYVENGRYFMNSFRVQLTGYEKTNLSTSVGNGFFSANYRFNCYWGNTSTVNAGIRFRTWSLCDNDNNTITNDEFKSLSSIVSLNKLSGSPSIDVRAYISTTTYSNFVNGQTITALSVKSSAGLPINWYAQVKQGITFMNNVGAF